MLGLFRGSTAGIMRNVPHSMLVYTIYPFCEESVLQQQKRLQQLQSGGSSSDSSATKKAFSTRFLAGYATLTAATLVTHPLDTLR